MAASVAFWNYGYPLTNVTTPKKVTFPVVKKIQKIRERGSSNLEIVDHLLQRDGLTKPITAKKSVTKNSKVFTKREHLCYLKRKQFL